MGRPPCAGRRSSGTAAGCATREESRKTHHRGLAVEPGQVEPPYGARSMRNGSRKATRSTLSISIVGGVSLELEIDFICTATGMFR